jgi:hypothetical protein
LPRRRRRRAGCLGLVGVLLVGLLAGALAIRVGCARPPELPAAPPGDAAAGTGGRPEVSTYLTFPEWYIVYAAREEAAWLREGRPSAFPYLGAIGQFWCGYAAVYDVTSRRYGFSVENHLMLAVIGTSFTAENAAKALYEGSVGRASEITGGWSTDEDRFAAGLALEYAAFMDETPWYAFPFGERLGALWQMPAGGTMRSWERRLALSAQLAVKAAYGWAIGQAVQAMYGPERLTTAVTVQPAAGGEQLLTLPRYAAFQPPLLALLRGGADVRAIEGNREILLTLLAPAAWRYDLPEGTAILEHPLLVDRARKRVAASVPVAGLRRFVAAVDERRIEIEHVYDY